MCEKLATLCSLAAEAKDQRWWLLSGYFAFLKQLETLNWIVASNPNCIESCEQAICVCEFMSISEISTLQSKKYPPS